MDTVLSLFMSKNRLWGSGIVWQWHGLKLRRSIEIPIRAVMRDFGFAPRGFALLSVFDTAKNACGLIN